MPLIVHKGLPCVASLRAEGYELLEEVPDGATPLRILLLNLMPQKEAAEAEYYRILSYSSLNVQVILAKMSHQKYKNTPQEYMDRFYTDVADLQDEFFDGMIITGSPVEKIPFEAVRYWKQLHELYYWSRKHVRSALHICWGAQAALYALYGISKYPLQEKCFGVFRQTVLKPDLPLFRGFDSTFNMPQSRHTEVLEQDIAREKKLQILSHSPLSGASIVMGNRGREIFVTGHLEYMPGRLDFEYKRDIGLGLPIKLPLNYYQDNDPAQPVNVSWRSAGYLFYMNWIKYYVANKNLDDEF